MPVIEDQVIVGLQQWIAELSKRNAFISFESPLDGFFSQQTIHRKIFSDIAEELHHRDRSEPVRIVDDARRIRRRVEIKKAAQLLFNTNQVFFDLSRR